jgi:AbrB family looped-hinge helix DNA binding protein
MALARSRVTSQGQISVPAGVRRKLGLSPGSVLGWYEVGGDILVRREGRYSSHDIHQVLFPEGKPARRSIEEMKAGIERSMREKHGRR